jgi:hypothetical protein
MRPTREPIENTGIPAPRQVNLISCDLAFAETDSLACLRTAVRPPRYRRSPFLRLEKGVA